MRSETRSALPFVTRAPSPVLVVAVLGLTAVTAVLARIGGDLLWLDAVGRALTSGQDLSRGLPFAQLPTAHWPNVPVLAELTIHGMRAAGGDRAVLVLHLAAVSGALAVLAYDARREGAGPRAIAAALVLLAIGASTTLFIIRLSLFSVLLMPVLLALLRAEGREPSRRIWWVVPLLALWSNLHGAALLGVLVAYAYLLLSRLRAEPVTAALVAAPSLLALCLTPALAQTPRYYWRAVHNEAALQHVGLWARLSLHSVPDVLFLLVAAALLGLAVRGRPQLWEWAVLAGLAILTASAARHGVWLLMASVGPAARGLRLASTAAEREQPALARPSPLVAGTAVAAVAVIAMGVSRGPVEMGATRQLLTTTLRSAGGEPVLADGLLAEQVSATGGKIWIGNPLDAFRQADQRWYTTWSERGTTSLIPKDARVLLVTRDSAPARALRRDLAFRERAHDARATLFLRR